MKPILIFSLICFQAVYAQINYTLIKQYDDHVGEIECVVLSPDAKTLVTADEMGYMIFWDVASMTPIAKVKEHSARINSLLFNKSGTKFVTCDENGKVKLWDFATRKVLKEYTAAFNIVAFAVLSDDEKFIYFGGYSTSYTSTRSYVQTSLYRVNVNGESAPEIVGKNYFDSRPTEADAGITDGNIDVTGKYIIITKGTHTYFWSVEKQAFTFNVNTSYSLNNLLPTSDFIYVWGSGSMIKLDVRSGYRPTLTIDATTNSYSASYSKMAISNDKKLLVSGEDGNNVNIWTLPDLTLNQVLVGHKATVKTFTFAKNDSILITGGYDGELIVWGNPVKEKDSVIVPVVHEVVFAENNIPVSIKERDVELQSTITVNEPEFDIEVWDQSVVDGDSISLNLNGNWILQDHMVEKEKFRIHIKVDQNFSNNYLILYALNLGTISPNTAAVQVLIGDKKYKLQLTSDLKKSGALNFSYVPK